MHICMIVNVSIICIAMYMDSYVQGDKQHILHAIGKFRIIMPTCVFAYLMSFTPGYPASTNYMYQMQHNLTTDTVTLHNTGPWHCLVIGSVSFFSFYI